MVTKTANQRDSYIIHRECNTCASTHKNIYYKRLLNPAAVQAPYETFMFDFSAARTGVSGTDFALYSTLQDALDGVRPWTACAGAQMNQSGGEHGFPGDCGPAAATAGQWVSRGSTQVQANFQFSMYRIGSLTKTLTLNAGEALTSVTEYYAGTDTVSKLVFKTSDQRTLDCADNTPDADLKERAAYTAAANMMITHIDQSSDGTVTKVKYEDRK